MSWSDVDEVRRKLHAATLRWSQAQAYKATLGPGDPGYRDAVHAVGVAWAQVQMWQRRLARCMADPEAGGGD